MGAVVAPTSSYKPTALWVQRWHPHLHVNPWLSGCSGGTHTFMLTHGSLGAMVTPPSLCKPTALELDLRPAQQKGIHIWYWKPSQLLRDSEVTDLGGEPPATT